MPEQRVTQDMLRPEFVSYEAVDEDGKDENIDDDDGNSRALTHHHVPTHHHTTQCDALWLACARTKKETLTSLKTSQ